MDKHAIHIAFASDAEGVEGLAVTAYSALELSSRPVYIWVIDDRIPKRAQAALEKLWSQCPTFAGATFIAMSSLPVTMPSMWARKGWPVTAAARFQLADVLPAEVDKCIYMDIDILVGVDLAELHDIDLADKPVGMVLNLRMPDDVREYIRSIDLDPDLYCNSGVLLIDLAAWRRERAGPALIECGIAMPANIWFFDQDMLNTYFKGRCAVLEERWNFRDAGASPAGKIQHFAGGAKPWSVTQETAVLAGHVAWHQVKRRSGFQAPQIPAYVKWRKSLAVLVAKLQRRMAGA